MNHPPPISHLRGLSDPFYFEFDTQGMQGRVLCHAVLFSSFEVADDNKELKICTLDRDPRMVRFVRFVRENWGTKKLAEEAMSLEARIARMKKQIDECEATLKNLREQTTQIQKP